jgi:hypothetical protein
MKGSSYSKLVNGKGFKAISENASDFITNLRGQVESADVEYTDRYGGNDTDLYKNMIEMYNIFNMDSSIRERLLSETDDAMKVYETHLE